MTESEAWRKHSKILRELKQVIGSDVTQKELLTSLLEFRLHMLEDQVGGGGESAGVLWNEYVKSLMQAVTESVDDIILDMLRRKFIALLKRHGLSGLDRFYNLFQSVINKAAKQAGYEFENGED